MKILSQHDSTYRNSGDGPGEMLELELIIRGPET